MGREGQRCRDTNDRESFLPLSREFPRNREHFLHLFTILFPLPYSFSFSVRSMRSFECRLSPSLLVFLFSFSFLRISRHSIPSPFPRRSAVFLLFQLTLSLSFILPSICLSLDLSPFASSFIRISRLSIYSP